MNYQKQTFHDLLIEIQNYYAKTTTNFKQNYATTVPNYIHIMYNAKKQQRLKGLPAWISVMRQISLKGHIFSFGLKLFEFP